MKCSVCKSKIDINNDYCPVCKTEHALDYGAFPTFTRIKASDIKVLTKGMKKYPDTASTVVSADVSYSNKKPAVVVVVVILVLILIGSGIAIVSGSFSKTKNKQTGEKPNAKTSTKATEIETSVVETTASIKETENAVTTPLTTEAVSNKDQDFLSYADYVAAELDSEVVITGYVQATQSWWNNTITVYLQDDDGGYFLYNLACSQADAAYLIPGAEIRVKGYKSEWAGEVEIVDGTFEYLGQTDKIYEAKDLTAIINTDSICDYQNQFVSFDDMTVVSVEFKNGEPGDDIYLILSKDGTEYSFCLEYYLNGDNYDLYNKVSSLQPGSKVRVEAFLYWYEGINPHIVSVEVK